MKTSSFIKFIDIVGFFRLTMIPLGLVILFSAYQHRILGMGIIGLVVLIFGILNKCLLLGQCEIDSEKQSKKSKKPF
jgi:hypothetical protein